MAEAEAVRKRLRLTPIAHSLQPGEEPLEELPRPEGHGGRVAQERQYLLAGRLEVHRGEPARGPSGVRCGTKGRRGSTLTWEENPVKEDESPAVKVQEGPPPFCGRPVSAKEWKILREILDSCGFSRHELASTICEALGWVRPNGRLKARECYEYLNLLEARGLVELPMQNELRGRGPTSITYTKAGEEGKPREGTLSDVSPVRLGLVTTAQERALWRELVERYHYLGHKVAYGAHLRYLVWISTPAAELAGCVQFSSAARRLSSRDTYIGWDTETCTRNLQQVVNNSRFLILPWLSIRGWPATCCRCRPG